MKWYIMPTVLYEKKRLTIKQTQYFLCMHELISMVS